METMCVDIIVQAYTTRLYTEQQRYLLPLHKHVGMSSMVLKVAVAHSPLDCIVRLCVKEHRYIYIPALDL